MSNAIISKAWGFTLNAHQGCVGNILCVCKQGRPFFTALTASAFLEWNLGWSLRLELCLNPGDIRKGLAIGLLLLISFIFLFLDSVESPLSLILFTSLGSFIFSCRLCNLNSPSLTVHLDSAFVNWELGWFDGLEVSQKPGDIRKQLTIGLLMLNSFIWFLFSAFLTLLWQVNQFVILPFCLNSVASTPFGVWWVWDILDWVGVIRRRRGEPVLCDGKGKNLGIAFNFCRTWKIWLFLLLNWLEWLYHFSTYATLHYWIIWRTRNMYWFNWISDNMELKGSRVWNWNWDFENLGLHIRGAADWIYMIYGPSDQEPRYTLRLELLLTCNCNMIFDHPRKFWRILGPVWNGVFIGPRMEFYWYWKWPGKNMWRGGRPDCKNGFWVGRFNYHFNSMEKWAEVESFKVQNGNQEGCPSAYQMGLREWSHPTLNLVGYDDKESWDEMFNGKWAFALYWIRKLGFKLEGLLILRLILLWWACFSFIGPLDFELALHQNIIYDMRTELCFYVV
ncbi:hypothetical protein L1987_20728 [Smallanthus sonchifolius]|uniref:Uncharacterized protein n=1 Tax=Smallanthus sonchifolius TaxID=185202 RepID=A0ACB9IRX4_9ASTR|nr:hypothetical protein L1987_20728 [Smallanthus sonchifolius]